MRLAEQQAFIGILTKLNNKEDIGLIEIDVTLLSSNLILFKDSIPITLRIANKKAIRNKNWNIEV